MQSQVGPNNLIPKSLVKTFSHSSQASECQDSQIVGQQYSPKYYHIRTPLTKADSVMFRFDLEGYAYGAALPLDITWCGYNCTDNTIQQQVNLNRNPSQTIKISQYYQGNNLVLKFGPINRYCNGFCLYYQGHYSNQTNLLNGTKGDLYKVTAKS